MGNSVMGGFGAQCCPAGCGSSSGAHKSSTMDSLAAMALPVPALASTSTRGKNCSVVTHQQHHPSSSPQRSNQHQTNSRSPAKPDFSSSDQMSFSRVKPISSNDRRTDSPMTADANAADSADKAALTRSHSRANTIKVQETDPDGQNNPGKKAENSNIGDRKQQQDALMEQAKVLESRRDSIERHQTKLQAEAEELFPTIGQRSDKPKQPTQRDNALVEHDLKPITNQENTSPRQPMNLIQPRNSSPVRPSAVVETDEELQDSLRLERELIELRQKVLAALKHATSLQHAQEVQEEEQKGARVLMSDSRITSGSHTSGFRQQQAVEAELVRVQELTKDVQRRRVDLSYRVNRSLRERSASSSHLDQMLMSSMVMFPQHHHSERRGQVEFNQPSHGDYSSTWARGRMNRYNDRDESTQLYSHPTRPFGIQHDAMSQSRDHHLAQQRLWHCQQTQQHPIPMTRSRTVGAGHARRASDVSTDAGPYSFLATSNHSSYYGGQPMIPDKSTFTMPSRSGSSNASWIQQQQDPWGSTNWTTPSAALINSRPMSMSHQHLGGLDDDDRSLYGHFHQQSRQPPVHHHYSNQQPSPRGHAEAFASLPYSTTSRVPLVPGHPPGMGIPGFHHLSSSTSPRNMRVLSSATPRNQPSPHSFNWEEESDWLSMRSPGKPGNQYYPNQQPAGVKYQSQPAPPVGESRRYVAPAPPGVASYSLLREMSSRSTTSPADPSIRRLHNSNSPGVTTQTCVTSPTPTVTDKIAARIGRTSLLLPQVATMQNKPGSAGSTNTTVVSTRGSSRQSEEQSGKNKPEVRPSGDGREDVTTSTNTVPCHSSTGMKSPSSNEANLQDGKGRCFLSQEEQEVLAELEHPETVIEKDPVLSQFKRSMSLPRDYRSAAGRMMSTNKLKNNNQHQVATTDKQQTNLGHHQHPDVVRSTIAMAMNNQSRSKGASKELKFNEDTIDSILGTPKKISIPERYVPEGVELTEEERATRSKKAEAIRKMLILSSGTNTGGSNFFSSLDVALPTAEDNKTAEDHTGRSTGDGASSDASGQEMRATAFAPPTTDEKGPRLSSLPPSSSSQADKQHMEHMLALNQALAKEVVERTAKVAERATPASQHHHRSMSISDDFLMCQTSTSGRKTENPISDNEDEESPVHPLPLVQQRDNYLT